MTSDLQDCRLNEIESDGYRHGFNLDRTNLLCFFFVLTVSIVVPSLFKVNFLNFVTAIGFSSAPVIVKIVKKVREKEVL